MEPEGRSRSSLDHAVWQADAEPMEVGYSATPAAVESTHDTVETPAEIDERHRKELADIGRPPPRWAALLLTPSNGVWTGLVVVALGCCAIFYSWGAVAGTLNANEQVASLIAWGFSGLALVTIGIVAVDVAVRLHDGTERKQQVAQVENALVHLRYRRSSSYYC